MPHSRRLLVLGPLVLALVFPGLPASGASPTDVVDPQALWQQVAARNRVWLSTSTEPLAYTLTSRLIQEPRSVRMVNRVWVSGAKSRWEMDRTIEPPVPGVERDNRTPNRYTVVCDGESAAYLRGPEALVTRPAFPCRDRPRLRQGITFTSAVHAAAQSGLPAGARIVEPDTPVGTGVVVIEADFGDARGNFGLGLFHSFFGQSQHPLGKVRLHVQTPELIPIREEYVDREFSLEYRTPFLAIGDQRAPSVVRHVSTLLDGKGEWVLEARFQSKDGRWLLERAGNLHNGKAVAEMKLSGVSTEAIDPTRFELTAE